MKSKWAIVLDTEKCIDCKACTVACKMENHVPLGMYNYRNWVAEKEATGVGVSTTRNFEPSQCQHCENPPCVHVCPTRASYQTEDGVVLVDHKKCIICKYCMTACPYDARFVSEHVSAVDKCTFCYHRLPEGRDPACVDTCPPKVRVFVDLNNLSDEMKGEIGKRGVTVLKPEKGTKPKLWYLK